MIDKALMIILFMYAVSFSMLGIEYELYTYGIQLVTFVPTTSSSGVVTPAGTPVKSVIVGLLNMGEFNARAQNIVTANYSGNTTYYDKIETFTTGAAVVAWELVTLLSGTYIFNLLALFGVPYYFVVGFVALYLFLLARAILGYVRGI